MQQRPARPSPAFSSRAARTAIAVVATVAAVPLAGHSARSHHVAGADVATTSAGTVAPFVTPALPRRVPVLNVRAEELAAALGAPPASGVPAPVALSARERVLLGGAGTYIGELLRARDSAVVRWPDRVERPLTVWVSDANSVADWRPTYLARVAAAFTDWTRTGVPMRFRFVQDSGAAEVHVAWTDRFSEPISGRTVWSHDEHWWMTKANITIALHHNDGTPLDDDQVHAIALHEVGHLLGLDHTTDPTSVMAARVRVRELSGPDQATARLVYALPAGHL